MVTGSKTWSCEGQRALTSSGRSCSWALGSVIRDALGWMGSTVSALGRAARTGTCAPVTAELWIGPIQHKACYSVAHGAEGACAPKSESPASSCFCFSSTPCETPNVQLQTSSLHRTSTPQEPPLKEEPSGLPQIAGRTPQTWRAHAPCHAQGKAVPAAGAD